MVDTSLGFTTPAGTDAVLPTSQLALTATDIDGWLTSPANLGAVALASYTGTAVTGRSVSFAATPNLRLTISGSLDATVLRFIRWRINSVTAALYRSHTVAHDGAGALVTYDGGGVDGVHGRTATYGATGFMVTLDFAMRSGLPMWTGTVSGSSSGSWVTGSCGGILRSSEVPSRFDVSVDTGVFDNLQIDVTGFPQ